MISILSIRLAPLLIALLDTDGTQVEDGVGNRANIFRPNPALQNPAVPGAFSELFELQKVYDHHGAGNTAELTELYKHWNAEIIKMMGLYYDRQKCQNCHQSHACQTTAVQWIKWHKMMLMLKVESVDESALNVLTILPRLIEREYQQRVRGSECRKQAGLKAGKVEDIRNREDDGRKGQTEDQSAPSEDDSGVTVTMEVAA